MSKQFKGERSPVPEDLEVRKYHDLQEAMSEEEHIMQEIDNVFLNTSNRVEAEKIVFEKWAPLMEEAMKKSGEALKTWLDIIYEAGERERKEIADMEENLNKE
jgi:hypothetical protein